MKTKELATCSIFTAMVIAALFFGSAIGIGVYAAPLLAIWLTLPILEKYGKKDYLLVYISASVLAIILIPDKELMLFYIGFGWYPAVTENKDNKKLPLILKIALYFAVIAIILLSECYILGLYDALISSLKESPVLEGILILSGLVLFLLADKTLDKVRKAFTKKLNKII